MTVTLPIDMKVLRFLYCVTAQAFYRWALREISPLHPDVPQIILRQRQLQEERRLLW